MALALHGTCYVVGERGPTGPVTGFDTHGRVDRRGDDVWGQENAESQQCSTVQKLYYYRV